YRQVAGVQALVENPPNDAKPANRLKELAPTTVWPALAEALAHIGRLEEAQAMAARTPTDCYTCLIARANVAAMAGDAAAANHWSGEAVRQGPHFNAAQTYWGQALLTRGQPDAAIAQFKAANKIGPHFADPIEGWGEALLVKGDFKGAAAKLAEASSFAPNWGRLHRKWGTALA